MAVGYWFLNLYQTYDILRAFSSCLLVYGFIKEIITGIKKSYHQSAKGIIINGWVAGAMKADG